MTNTLQGTTNLIRVINHLQIIKITARRLMSIDRALNLTFPLNPQSFHTILPRIIRTFQLLRFFKFYIVLGGRGGYPLIDIV